MNLAISFGLLLGLLVLPILVSGCLPDGRSGVPWYEARRDPTGLAPDPPSTPEAVIQIYAARAVSWRGVFAAISLSTIAHRCTSSREGARRQRSCRPTRRWLNRSEPNAGSQVRCRS